MRLSRSSIPVLATLALAAGAAWTPAAQAASNGWSLVLLHPSGAEASELWGGAAGVQVGKTRIAGKERAAVWRGSAETWVDYHQPGFDRSFFWATDGTRMVGEVSSPDRYALSVPALNAPGATFQRGVMFGAGGGQQVGQLLSGSLGSTRFSAALWTGTPESMVILTPTTTAWNIYESMARSTDGVQQVGRVSALIGWSQSVQFASLWTGTASSWVPLSLSNSEAVGVHNGVQVGWESRETTSPRFACLWRSTPASWQSMHPVAATSSVLIGVLDNHQVGAAQFNGRWRAGIWNGTPESFEDLDTLIPPGFTGSWATAIWRDGDRLYVGGIALRENGWPYQDNNQAVLWWKVAEPACVGDLNGDMVVDDLDFTIFAISYDAVDCMDAAMPAGCPADFNKDAFVDDADFVLFAAAYNELLCP
jgi:hypothetical protein